MMAVALACARKTDGIAKTRASLMILNVNLATRFAMKRGLTAPAHRRVKLCADVMRCNDPDQIVDACEMDNGAAMSRRP